MLFRKYIVSTRTLFQLAVALMLFVGIAGNALAQTGPTPPSPISLQSLPALTNAPQLIPLTINTVAGLTQGSNSATANTGNIGFNGDNRYATDYLRSSGSALNTPKGIAVDSAGNVYIADTASAIIREVNLQTGILTVVAGALPSHCNGLSCSANTGCADGVLAASNPIGAAVASLAVDGYGNLYFEDNITATISVVYRGGTRVADFISRVDPTGVTASGGVVQPGYVYHVGGTISLSTCTATLGNVDNALSFANSDTSVQGSTLRATGALALDSAGNIYIADPNNEVVRVINTQETAQTFFQYTVQPGYMKAIINCGILTVACPVNFSTTLNTGLGGPVNAATYGTGTGTPITGMAVDAYGNVYQTNANSGSATPFSYLAASYAGGAPLANLINLVSAYLPYSTSTPGAGGGGPIKGSLVGLTATYGDFYDVLDNAYSGTYAYTGYGLAGLVQNQVLRPLAVGVDPLGNLWYSDSNRPAIYHVDAGSQGQYQFIGMTHQRYTCGAINGCTLSNNVSNFAPTHCWYGAPSASVTLATSPWQGIGPETYDIFDDGCPVSEASMGSQVDAFSVDGLGNLYFIDAGTSLAREVTVGTTFPSTPIGTVTGYSISSNVITLNAVNSIKTINGLPVGNQRIKLSGFPNSTFLNGVSLLLSTTTQMSSTTIVAPFTYTDTPATTETGTYATTVSQAVQMHFYGSNLPVINTSAQTADISIAPGIQDFTFNTVDGVTQLNPSTPASAISGSNSYTGAPHCYNIGTGDGTYDCIMYISFNPSAPGLRTSALVANTQNTAYPGSAANPTYQTFQFPLTGIGYGSQLAIDGATPTTVTTSGLGTPSSVAVASSGTVYIADPSNNRIVVNPNATFSGTTTAKSAVITAASGTLGLASGWSISGTNIPTGTTIASVGTLNGYAAGTGVNGVTGVSVGAFGTVTMSSNAAAAGTGILITATGPEYSIGGTGVQVAGLALKNPMGVALDSAGNVYIADTGNNRIVEINTATGVQSVLGSKAWVSGDTANILPQYTFKAPQGLAVDSIGNVFVADTGNAAIVEIPANPMLGGAVPLFAYSGAPTFVKPVAVAIGPNSNGLNNYIYVADQGDLTSKIIIIPPGGGDMATLPPSVFSHVGTSNGFQPNGVAVDAAGDIYMSDATTGAVWVSPGAGGANGTPYILNLPGLKSPSGLALDPSGNLYIADSGNNQVLFDNRVNPTVSFGNVPEYLATASGIAGVTWDYTNNVVSAQCPVSETSTPCTGVLNVTNIGNGPATLTAPFLSVATPNAAFSIQNSTGALADTCNFTSANQSANLMPYGANCTISPTFYPTSLGLQSETININGAQSVTLAGASGTGALALANVTLASSAGTSVPAGTTTTTISAKVAETSIASGASYAAGVAPTGSVTFTWAVDANAPANYSVCGTNQTAGVTVPLVGSVATVPSSAFPALALGRKYTVSATYSGDTNYGATIANPLTVTVPGTSVVATASSHTYMYGATVPPINDGAVTGITDGSVPVFTTTATSTSLVANSPYPITVTFTNASGTSFCNWGFPTVYTTSAQTTPAVEVETAAPLAITVPAITTQYGAKDVVFSGLVTIVGAISTRDYYKLQGDLTFSDVPATAAAPYPPALHTSNLEVVPAAGSGLTNPYPVYAQISDSIISNYNLTVTSGTDTVVSAPPAAIAFGATETSVYPTQSAATATVINVSPGVPAASYSVGVSSGVTQGKGTPSGTVTVSDTFVPITATAPGVGAVVPACSISFIGSTTSGSSAVTGVPSALISLGLNTQGVSVVGIHAGETITGGGSEIPANTTITSIVGTGMALSANATVTNANALLTATVPSSTTCNPVLATTPAALSSGSAIFFPSSTAPIAVGTHYYSVAYSGDTDFTPGVTAKATTLLVNNPDFTLTSSTSVVSVTPGVTPVVSSSTQDSIITVNGVLQFAGQVSLTCQTQNAYVSCLMFPTTVTLAVGSESQASALTIWTPANLPLGYFNTSQIRTSSTKTALAFLPLGVLAFCVRRRRRLSKALWMLLAISAVSLGMSGCGGNLVAFYIPVPTGQQTVTVTGTFAGSTTPAIAGVSRSIPVTININSL